MEVTRAYLSIHQLHLTFTELVHTPKRIGPTRWGTYQPMRARTGHKGKVKSIKTQCFRLAQQRVTGSVHFYLYRTHRLPDLVLVPVAARPGLDVLPRLVIAVLYAPRHRINDRGEGGVVGRNRGLLAMVTEARVGGRGRDSGDLGTQID